MARGPGLYWEDYFGFKPYMFGGLTILFFMGGLYTLITDKNYWWLGLIAIFASIGMGILVMQNWKKVSDPNFVPPSKRQ